MIVSLNRNAGCGDRGQNVWVVPLKQEWGAVLKLYKKGSSTVGSQPLVLGRLSLRGNTKARDPQTFLLFGVFLSF